MQEMTVYGVSFDLVGKQPIVLLRAAEGADVPADLDRAPRGGRDPDEAPGAGAPAAAHPRPRALARRVARRRGRPDHRDRAQGQHVLRADHARPGRHGDRDRLPAVRRDRARDPGGREDLRRGRGDRRVRRRLGGRRPRPRLRPGRRRTSATSTSASSGSSSTPSRRTSSRPARTTRPRRRVSGRARASSGRAARSTSASRPSGGQRPAVCGRELLAEPPLAVRVEALGSVRLLDLARAP